MPEQENIPKGVAFAIATTLMASTAATASKLIAGEVSVPQIVLAQYLIGLMVTLIWQSRSFSVSLKTSRFTEHMIRGVAGWLCFYAYYQALAYIPLVDAALLRNTGPLFVPLVVYLWLKKKVSRRAWLPMLLGFAGVLMILKPDLDGVSQWHLIGLLSGILLAVSMVGTRALSSTEPASRILFFYFLISFACSLPVALLNWQPIPASAYPYLLYIGLAIHITMWLYTKAYTFARASVVSPINYSGVVFSGLLGWFIWEHVPDYVSLAGMLLVVGAGLLSVFLNMERTNAAPVRKDATAKKLLS